MASAAAAVGLTVAGAGFAGRYVLQAMKHNMEPQVKQVFQSLPKSVRLINIFANSLLCYEAQSHI